MYPQNSVCIITDNSPKVRKKQYLLARIHSLDTKQVYFFNTRSKKGFIIRRSINVNTFDQQLFQLTISD